MVKLICQHTHYSNSMRGDKIVVNSLHLAMARPLQTMCKADRMANSNF